MANSKNALTAVVWFRSDLRLADNPALSEALRQGYRVLPVFIWAPEEEAPWAPGAASRVWLDRSLRSLSRDLEKKGSRLVLRSGRTLDVLRKLIQETQAQAVFWNRRYEPVVIRRDQEIKTALKQDGVAAESFNASLLFEPWEILNQQGKPYQVFTPYWNALQAMDTTRAPRTAPKRIPLPESLSSPESLKTLSLESLDLLPRIPWDTGIRRAWEPGEKAAAKLLSEFLETKNTRYATHRDLPGSCGTSRLSPYLHFGEIGPRQVWHFLKDRPGALPYLRQIAWREFSHALLYHFPHTPEKPLRAEFQNFPWDASLETERRFTKWTHGETGFPIVDAGMRELWETGWMHNRVRMIAASFLVKDLLIPWQRGARWFWDTLVDADLANNTMGWQWVAGCGADAAPFFRIFNPTSQAKKFDADGNYTRRWATEKHTPVVDHDVQRRQALAAYARVKKR